MSILDQVASQQRHRPTSIQEYLALQFARKLGDLGALKHYMALFDRHPEHLLLKTYKCCGKQKTGLAFMNCLKQITKNK